MSEHDQPRTKLDVLYKDMLGDVASLATQLERIMASVAACTEEAKKLPMDMRVAVAETGRQINAEAVRSMNQAVDRLEKVAISRQNAESTKDHYSQRTWLYVLAALVGGVMVGFALALVLVVWNNFA